MSSSINELLADSTKRPVHIAIFGSPGVGKSTIGNFILNNHHKGPFKTFSGTDASTRASMTKSCDNVSFTDFPGLPDTEPKSTKSRYNMCIDELKFRKFSVLLFVLPKGRVEVDVYKRAGILFREINKVECTKILIINDKNSHGFKGPSPNYDNEISKLAGTISACTNILFNKTISMTYKTMKEKIEDLMVTIKSYRRRPVMYPQLRNFDELVLWVDELRKNKEYHAAVRKEKTEKKERLQGELRMYRALETGIVIAGAGAAVAGGAAVAVGALAAQAAAALAPALACGASGTATFGGLHFISNSLDERIKKIEEELDQGEFDAAAEELEKEMLEFAKLRDALDAQEQEEEEEEEEKSD